MPTSDDDKYDEAEISKDPADYLNGPTGNSASRGTGGTTRSGSVQVIKVDDGIRATSTEGQTDADDGAAGAQGTTA